MRVPPLYGCLNYQHLTTFSWPWPSKWMDCMAPRKTAACAQLLWFMWLLASDVGMHDRAVICLAITYNAKYFPSWRSPVCQVIKFTYSSPSMVLGTTLEYRELSAPSFLLSKISCDVIACPTARSRFSTVHFLPPNNVRSPSSAYMDGWS